MRIMTSIKKTNTSKMTLSTILLIVSDSSKKLKNYKLEISGDAQNAKISNLLSSP